MKSAAMRQMTRCFVLRIVPYCLPLPKMHSIIARRELRHAIALAARGPFVDGAPAALASFGDAVVLRHMRRDDEGTKIGHMIGRIIGLVDFQHPLRGTTLGGAVGESEHAGPCRFSMVAWRMWESFAFRSAGFAKATSGSLVLACVSFLRFWS
jgi:hypothetical protein